MKRNDNGRPTRGLSVNAEKDFHKALKIFSKRVQDDGILKEYRERMQYESPSERKQRHKKVARKRWLTKVEQMKESGQWTHRETTTRKY